MEKTLHPLMQKFQRLLIMRNNNGFLALPEGHPARKAAQRMDETLSRFLQNTQALSLIATGGYGRGTLAPFSDIDILFLHTAPLTPAEETTIRTLLYTLWDAGISTGHAVRTVAETLKLAADNHATFTSLLDMRCAAGNTERHSELSAAFHALLAAKRDTFITAKCAELRARHAAQNAKPLNILKSAGGLRDMQTLHWLNQAGANSALNEEALAAHHQYLWNIRMTLAEDSIATPPEMLPEKMQHAWHALIAPHITALSTTKAA